MVFRKSKITSFSMKSDYSSLKEMLSDVVDYFSQKEIEAYEAKIHIPSKKYGLPYTDQIIINTKDGEVFKFIIIESEAQSYEFTKIVCESNLKKEILRLENISGSFEGEGYEIYHY